jgi:hypothetical protein
MSTKRPRSVTGNKSFPGFRTYKTAKAYPDLADRCFPIPDGCSCTFGGTRCSRPFTNFLRQGPGGPVCNSCNPTVPPTQKNPNYDPNLPKGRDNRKQIPYPGCEGTPRCTNKDVPTRSRAGARGYHGNECCDEYRPSTAPGATTESTPPAP